MEWMLGTTIYSRQIHCRRIECARGDIQLQKTRTSSREGQENMQHEPRDSGDG